MAQVTLRINGHAHTVGCQDGEEVHLQAMAEQVELRIEKAKSLGVPSGEARLLVMAALFMADELHDTAAELAAMRKKTERLEAKTSVEGKAASERAKAERLSRLAARAEAIAGSAEQH